MRVTKKQLEEKIQKLQKELREVCVNPESIESLTIKTREMFNDYCAKMDATMFFDLMNDEPKTFDGLFHKIQQLNTGPRPYIPVVKAIKIAEIS